MPVEVLDGVFQRQDMAPPVVVDFLYQRCQRRGLSASRGPGHQNQPALFLIEFNNTLREPQLLRFRHPGIHHTDGRSIRTALAVHVDSEPSQLRHAEGQVHLSVLFQRLQLLFIHDACEQPPGIIGHEPCLVLHRHQLAVHANNRHRGHGNMHIRCAALPGGLQNIQQLFIYLWHVLSFTSFPTALLSRCRQRQRLLSASSVPCKAPHTLLPVPAVLPGESP